jgi:peptide/nickel transport system permease protein
MVRYLLRKAVFYLVALWAAISLNFLLPRLVPGSPVDVILARTQQTQPLPPEARAALNLQFGVTNDPLWLQYWHYLGNLVHGQFGVSVTFYPLPAATMVRQALPWTIVLVGLATLIAVTIGLALGALTGWKRGTWLDGVLPATTFLAAIPYFWFALVLQFVFASKLGWFPLSGGYDDTTSVAGFNGPFLASAITHGLLPAATIVLSSVAGWMLGMRNVTVSTTGEDYVLAAEAKGLRPRRVLLAYAARNAVLPSVAGFAITLGFVVGGSLITETVFSYPGLGTMLLQAVTNVDYPLMQAIFLFITLAVLSANFVVDMLYGLIDPRTRGR